MRVKTGNGIYLEARAKAEAAESVVTTDYYTQLPQIRLGDFTGRSVQPETTAEVMLDGDDVSKLVECAVRHPAPKMRSAVLRRSGTARKCFGRLFSSVLKHPSLFLKYARSSRRSLATTRLRLDHRLRHSQAGRRAAATSDALAGPSARSREGLVEARCIPPGAA
jgi:hypothetical protein